MKRKPYQYPHMLALLMRAGIGRRKARRMIKHAVFVGHKTNNSSFTSEDKWASISSFCIWADQGKYVNSWVEAQRNANK